MATNNSGAVSGVGSNHPGGGGDTYFIPPHSITMREVSEKIYRASTGAYQENPLVGECPAQTRYALGGGGTRCLIDCLIKGGFGHKASNS